MLSPELTSELKIILKEDFNQDLSLSEVKEIGNNIVQFHEILARMKQESEQNNRKEEVKKYAA